MSRPSASATERRLKVDVYIAYGVDTDWKDVVIAKAGGKRETGFCTVFPKLISSSLVRLYATITYAFCVHGE
jgi:hypothetical protein